MPLRAWPISRRIDVSSSWRWFSSMSRALCSASATWRARVVIASTSPGSNSLGSRSPTTRTPIGRSSWSKGTADGTGFPVETSLSPMEAESGPLVSSAIRDITEQRALRAQLRDKNADLERQYQAVQEANRLKSEFLANMSHELRTPSTGSSASPS
jgi:signal transduction histidine kinase